MRPIIDAHLDLSWNALNFKRDLTLPLGEMNRADARLTDHKSRGRATTTLPEMRRGNIALCLGTLIARVPHSGSPRFEAGDLDFRVADMAHAAALGQLSYYQALEARDEVRLIRTRAELDEHWSDQGDRDTADSSQKRPGGLILAMEGADPIVDPSQAELWFEAGLRCASLVHYGSSAYAVGTGEEGPITAAGRALLAEFERLGIVLDVTHLSDRSFAEALDVHGGPVLASHNNCRALVPHQRQFSDEQLARLIERGGIIGVACDAWMLSPGFVAGETRGDVVSIDALADHVDHICALAGSTAHVAIGSDLDGGFGTEQTPAGLETIADLQKLDAILASRGYSDDDIDAILHGNWLRFLRDHLPADDGDAP